MKSHSILVSVFLLTGTSSLHAQVRWSEVPKPGYTLISQQGGRTLGYSPKSGVRLLTANGFAFKDLNRNGKLDAYEDWRRSPQERAADLASQLSIDEIAGLMLYSAHQAVPSRSGASHLNSILNDDQKRAVRQEAFKICLRQVFKNKLDADAVSKVDLSGLNDEQKQIFLNTELRNAASQYLVAAGGRGAHYGGMLFEESHAKASDLTDEQKAFLKNDNLRAILVTQVESPRVAAEWNNNQQSFVEGLGHGIPANTSSDPRHETTANAEFNAGAGGQISLWPSSLGMGATFDPAVVKQFGQIASQEYRALGIATALSPQIDVATEPRWWRYNGTFGEDPQLATDMARAYCEGFQTSPAGRQIADGWGWQSVNAMVKHWYGYGAQEAGRDSHFASGKYAVFPGNNLMMHKRPFVDGAFRLEGGTKMASAVMPIYSILWHQDPSGENVGGSYSKWLIQKQLREEAHFEGVVCTDWGITADNTAMDYMGGGKPWGVEKLSVAERHYKVLQAGVDQFGGNNEKGSVIEAYNMWVRDFGEQSARQRFEQSARRLLLNMFRVGLFDNPYTDPDAADTIVGNANFMKAGYQAQLKSVVMLKNHGNKILPITARKIVYIPKRHYPAVPGIWGGMSDDHTDYPIDLDLVRQYYHVTDNPAEADFALCIIGAPALNLGYDPAEVAKENNGYVPISLQYNDYTAAHARRQSIAGGDPLEKFTNRTYHGKTISTRNRDDLQMVLHTKKAMGSRPVVTIVELGKPVILSELEPHSDGILLSFGVQHQALLDIISGKYEPSGLLPMQLPADMETVETQQEDVPHDMKCLRDADGHDYDFAFGLNWKGVIHDWRTAKYKK